jgi:hypothetical protein
MPVDDYGVWKGLPVHYEVEDRYEDPHSPHLSLYYHDNPEKEPQFDLMYRQKHKNKPPNKHRPREIPGLFRAAINIKSTDWDTQLAHWVNYNLAWTIFDLTYLITKKVVFFPMTSTAQTMI